MKEYLKKKYEAILVKIYPFTAAREKRRGDGFYPESVRFQNHREDRSREKDGTQFGQKAFSPVELFKKIKDNDAV